MTTVKMIDNGKEVEVMLVDGDILMRATGDVFTLEWDDDSKTGSVIRWNHVNGERTVLDRGGKVMIASSWYRFKSFCFFPKAEHLALVNYPKGGTWSL